MMRQQIVKYVNLLFLLLLVSCSVLFLVFKFNPYLLNNFFKIKDIKIIGTEKTDP